MAKPYKTSNTTRLSPEERVTRDDISVDSKLGKAAKFAIGAATPGALATKYARASQQWAEGDFGNLGEFEAITKKHFGIDPKQKYRTSAESLSGEQAVPEEYKNIQYVVLSDSNVINRITEYSSELDLKESTETPPTSASAEPTPTSTEAPSTSGNPQPTPQAAQDSEHSFAPFKVYDMRKWGTRTVLVLDVKDRPFFTGRGIISFTVTLPGIKDRHYAPAILYTRSAKTGDQIQKLSDIKLPFRLAQHTLIIGSESLSQVSKKMERPVQMPEVLPDPDYKDELYLIERLPELVYGLVVKIQKPKAKADFFQIVGYDKASHNKVVIRPYIGNLLPGMKVSLDSYQVIESVIDAPIIHECVQKYLQKYNILTEEAKKDMLLVVKTLKNLLSTRAVDTEEQKYLDCKIVDELDDLLYKKNIFWIRVLIQGEATSIHFMNENNEEVLTPIKNLTHKFNIDAEIPEESSVEVSDAVSVDDKGTPFLKTVKFIEGSGAYLASPKNIVEVRNGKPIYSGKVVHVLALPTGVTKISKVVGKTEDGNIVLVNKPGAFKSKYEEIEREIKKRRGRRY